MCIYYFYLHVDDLELKAVVHQFIIKLIVKQWLKSVIQYVAKTFILFKLELSRQTNITKQQQKYFDSIVCLTIPIFIFRDVNNNIMELLIMAYACKTSSARSIVGVIPYLPYSKQCKMRKRGCIVSKLLAKVINTQTQNTL